MMRNLLLGLAISGILIAGMGPSDQAEGTPPAATPVRQNEDVLGVTWKLVDISWPDGTSMRPGDPLRYSIKFKADGTIRGVVACNFLSGPYQLDGSHISIGDVQRTFVYCPQEPLDTVYQGDLGNLLSFRLDQGQLLLTTRIDGSVLRFSSGLEGNAWVWLATEYGMGDQVGDGRPSQFTITFQPNGRLAVELTCNRGVGAYETHGDRLTIGVVALTQIACETGSTDVRMVAMLSAVETYDVRQRFLILQFHNTDQSMMFSAAPDNGDATPSPTRSPST